MTTEEKHKVLYKFELGLLKIIPMLLALCYLSNTILSYYGVDTSVFSFIGGVSIIPLIFLYLSSYVFRFCEYHRMFLHYLVINNILSWIDMEYGIPISDRNMFITYLIIAGIFLFLVLYLKFKVCKKQ